MWYGALPSRRFAACRARSTSPSNAPVGPLSRALNTSDDLWEIEIAVRGLSKIANGAALAVVLSYAKSAKSVVMSSFVDDIASFQMEPATEFLLKKREWRSLWPKHKDPRTS